MEKFNYSDAVKKLEEIALKVEDPSTDIEAIERYLKQSEDLVSRCRAYLRGARETLDKMDE